MRRTLIYLALVVLDEAVEEARRQIVKPRVSIRFALAYLYSQSDQKNRKIYDSFWKTVTGLDESPSAQPDYCRGNDACGYLQGICRSVNIHYTVDVMLKLAKGHRDKGDREPPRI